MKFSVVVCLLFGATLLFSPNLWAQSERSFVGVSQRLDHLTKELDEIEKKAQEILSDQDKIIEEIKNVKIWSRR